MFELIKTLTQTFGPSGYEKKVSLAITDLLKDKVDEIRADALGNLICVKKGSGKKIMLAAHMDEIGIIVSYIDEKGFLRFGNIGGIPPLMILGQRVAFENGTTGVIWYEEDIDNIADILNTINYEVVCMLKQRVVNTYKES
jgi:endoglucanase